MKVIRVPSIEKCIVQRFFLEENLPGQTLRSSPQCKVFGRQVACNGCLSFSSNLLNQVVDTSSQLLAPNHFPRQLNIHWKTEKRQTVSPTIFIDMDDSGSFLEFSGHLPLRMLSTARRKSSALSTSRRVYVSTLGPFGSFW